MNEQTGGKRYSALHLAVGSNSLAVVSTLLRAGALVNAQDINDYTPLHYAALRVGPNRFPEGPEVITALIANGADPHAPNVHGDTSLQLVKERSDSTEFLAAFDDEAVAAFREKQRQAEREAREMEVERQVRKSRVSCKNWNTPTFFRHATADDVTRCLETKNPNAKDGQGRSPMHVAALEGMSAVVAALSKAGADPNALDGKGRTPLHLVAVFGDSPEAVSALVKAGADLDATDGKGRTPLEYAEKFGEAPAVVAALRSAEVDASAPALADVAGSCKDWNTPGFFRRATPEDLTRCLETQDPNARNENGRTPMHYAAQGTSPALVTVLAEAGAELNAPDGKGGWTPLHLAAWFSKTPSVVAALLAAGADPAAADKAGKTPWDYARSNAALEGTPPYWRLEEERSR